MATVLHQAGQIVRIAEAVREDVLKDVQSFEAHLPILAKQALIMLLRSPVLKNSLVLPTLLKVEVYNEQGAEALIQVGGEMPETGGKEVKLDLPKKVELVQKDSAKIAKVQLNPV